MADFASTRVPAPFVVGVGRSGTTLLRLMLDAHPDLAIPGETHFSVFSGALDADGLTRDQFFRGIVEAPTWPNFMLDEVVFRKAFDEIEPFSTSEALRLFYRLYARRFGKERWGDKTPTYRSHMVKIQHLLPEAHFIHIIRDGRDVALSYQGLWFGPGDDIEEQARFWVDQLQSMRDQSSELRHYLEVRYERLVTDPELTLRRICSYLELPFDAPMLNYYRFACARLAEFRHPFGPPGETPTDIARFVSIHNHTKHPPDPSRIRRWGREMSSEDRQRYESIAGPLLLELGYEV